MPPNPHDVDGNGQVTPLDVLAVINYINSHPLGSSEGEALQQAAGVQARLVSTSPDSGGQSVQASPDLLVGSLAEPTPRLAMGSVVPWSETTNDLVASLVTASQQVSQTNGSWDVFLPPCGDERDRSTFRQTAGVPGATSRRVFADRTVSAADSLFPSLEDVLPDLAADIDLAWRTR